MKNYRITYWFTVEPKEKTERIIYTRSNNIKEAKEAARSFAHRELRDAGRGAIQINALMNSLRLKVSARILNNSMLLPSSEDNPLL